MSDGDLAPQPARSHLASSRGDVLDAVASLRMPLSPQIAEEHHLSRRQDPAPRSGFQECGIDSRAAGRSRGAPRLRPRPLHEVAVALSTAAEGFLSAFEVLTD